MGNLVLTRNPGESIDIYDPDNEAMGVIVITQGTIRGKHSSIAIDAPRHLKVKRSEISNRPAEPVIEDKYYSIGPDPIEAIREIGFTGTVSCEGGTAYVHESLPIFMRYLASSDGWVCVARNWVIGHKSESLDSLKDYVLGVALDKLRLRGAK